MVARTLVDKAVEGGRLLLEELDKSGRMEIVAALWFYLLDIEEWRLLLASQIVDDRGPLAAYEIVQHTLAKVPEDVRPEFTDISVVSPTDRRIQAIGKAITTGPEIGAIRFSRSAADNMYIEDALIYRLN